MKPIAENRFFKVLTENYLARKTFAKKTVSVAFSENN